MNEAAINQSEADRWLARLSPVVILLAALAYYGSYIGFWFNPHDEGGTAALTAMRLLNGEAPIRDVELGYNVGWFWPIVGLFKVVGVNFIAMRAYFFCLSTLTALLGWNLVRRLSGKEWLGLLAGLALVIFPGSQFKNYIPLLCVANTYCVAAAAMAYRAPEREFWWRLAIGGVTLGLAFLIRIDLGYLFTGLWLGALSLLVLQREQPLGKRLGEALGAMVLVLAAAFFMQVPAYFAAKQGQYDEAFVAQYPRWARSITGRAGDAMGNKAAPKSAVTASIQTTDPKPAAPHVDRSTLSRVSWDTARTFKDEEKTALFALTYWPLVIYLGLFSCALAGVFRSVKAGTFAITEPSALALVVLVGSLGTFPQYFFFRPDRPHLSEFMPGYIAATVASVALLSGWSRRVLAALLGLQLALFAWFAMDHYSAGTIAARTSIKKAKRIRFHAENGVHVWVHKDKEFPVLEGVRKAVAENSQPTDWLVCYPYQPGYNVMTNRRTYQREIYQDNATVTANWSARTIVELEAMKPKVVIVDDRAINQNDASRFSVWAKEAYHYIQEKYQPCGTFESVQVFVRQSPPHP